MQINIGGFQFKNEEILNKVNMFSRGKMNSQRRQAEIKIEPVKWFERNLPRL